MLTEAGLLAMRNIGFPMSMSSMPSRETRVEESSEHIKLFCWAGKTNGTARLGNYGFRIGK